MKKCLDCGKAIHRKSKRCASCAKKGELNPIYGKHGLAHQRYGKKHSKEAKKKMRESAPLFKSTEHKKKISEANKKLRGPANPNWKGGKLRKFDYVLIWVNHHPFRDKRGYVQEHRLVMEKHLGRSLSKKEIVHHINGIKDDNRIENLRVFPSINEHSQFHKQINRRISCDSI